VLLLTRPPSTLHAAPPPTNARRFLILIAVVCTVLVVMINVYILVHFQHPEDRNQAWFPKFVVVFGLTLSVLSILLLPLDVVGAVQLLNPVYPKRSKAAWCQPLKP
jgi:hypothetical protein